MRTVEWTNNLVLRGGIKADYMGKCPVTGKHRVRQFLDGWKGDPGKGPYTVWLLDDYGRCRGDLAPCDQDYLEAA